MASLDDAHRQLQGFAGPRLRSRISQLETGLRGADNIAYAEFLARQEISPGQLIAALILKRASAQINEIVHALGILLALPAILEDGETIEYVSLAAGNTGRAFDLETSRRIAEFKFTDWKGGPEAIRQNQLFKDFYLLAEHATAKERYLYFLGAEAPLKFLNGKRALRSVMSRGNKLWADFQRQHGDRFLTVGDYYQHRAGRVRLVDLRSVVPLFNP
ncbi:MAG TPA: hypothetical protein VGE07_19325 [Herpetosiphonaceae bacterium]